LCRNLVPPFRCHDLEHGAARIIEIVKILVRVLPFPTVVLAVPYILYLAFERLRNILRVAVVESALKQVCAENCQQAQVDT